MIEIFKTILPWLLSAIVLICGYALIGFLRRYFVSRKECEECHLRIKTMETAMKEFVTDSQFDKRMNGLLGVLHTRMDSFTDRIDMLATSIHTQLADVKKTVEMLLEAKLKPE